MDETNHQLYEGLDLFAEGMEEEDAFFFQITQGDFPNNSTASIPILDWGQNHPDWIQFVSCTLKANSQDIYNKRVNDLILWVMANESSVATVTPEIMVKDFLTHLESLKKVDGSPAYAKSRFRSLASIYEKFWLYSGI